MFSEASVSHSVQGGVGYFWSHVLCRGRVSLVPCPFGGRVLGVEYLGWVGIPRNHKAGGMHSTRILSC